MSESVKGAPAVDGNDDGPGDSRTELSAIRSIKPTYVYQQVATELARYITANDMQPGDILPSERDLCAQLSASRPSLREALRMLELVGLVKTRQGGRTVVGSFDLQFLTEWLGRAIPRSNENLRGLLVVRDVLEVRAAELAAELIEPEQCAELEANLLQTAEKVSREDEVLQEDIQFHEIIFRSCGNPVLQRLTDVIAGLLIELRQGVFAGAGGGEKMLASHQRIADALLARDPEAAGQAMREHMESVRSHADRLLGSD